MDKRGRRRERLTEGERKRERGETYKELLRLTNALEPSE